jgi:ABC-type transporter Mla MlaB component
MATKDNSNGLLSKMAKFVRNPTTNWSDLDKAEAEQDSGYSKLALKEIIERKRQNDFVRRREFDYLRKLRRNGPTPNQSLPSRPSFFQTSIASNQDERAMTLRKIDEIEAQMSKQWWKGRQEPVVPRAVPVPPLVQPPKRRAGGTPDGKSGFSPTLASEMSPGWDSLHTVDYASTQMGQQDPSEGVESASTLPLVAFNRPALPPVDAGTTDFSTSNLFSVDAADMQADPELEEAAIRFANGDDAGAEAGLLSALQASDVAPESADRWAAALFDLYRATGQQSSFDSVAIDYAMRFGRSAPAWFSLPDLLGGIMPLPKRQEVAAATTDRAVVWECPVALNVVSMQGLLDCAASSTVSLQLHWSQMHSITPDAAKLLADLFTRWCSERVRLHMAGFEALDRTLRALTPSGDKSVEPYWWRLRLDALRILRLQDEFELAALDYCVTFEVSPPPWKDALCELVHGGVSAQVSGLHRLGNEVDRTATTDFFKAITVRAGVESLPASRVELNGEILGDAAQALDDLQAGLKGADRLVISCSRLIRVDFSAAGSILNWVAVRESEGCHVQFRDVPRLVAAFFSVIGINEHARVVVRNT